jgi:hypothetical protein
MPLFYGRHCSHAYRAGARRFSHPGGPMYCVVQKCEVKGIYLGKRGSNTHSMRLYIHTSALLLTTLILRSEKPSFIPTLRNVSSAYKILHLHLTSRQPPDPVPSRPTASTSAHACPYIYSGVKELPKMNFCGSTSGEMIPAP